jgi:hypothetical protein
MQFQRASVAREAGADDDPFACHDAPPAIAAGIQAARFVDLLVRCWLGHRGYMLVMSIVT